MRSLNQPIAPPTVFDVERIRVDFPIFQRKARGKPFIYFDTASSAQKPMPVLRAMQSFYQDYYANIHRGVYDFSEQSTKAFEDTREKARKFIGAGDKHEIVFVRGTTEAMNLVARSFGGKRLSPGDEVVISEMEHHSGIVPWQIVCDERGAKLKVIPMNDRGELDLDAYERLLTKRTRIVSVVYVSNALGTVNPVEAMIRTAHEKGIPVVVDAAQAVPQIPIDVTRLDCDFLAFSGHKLYGPNGIGVLYGKREFLEEMPPYQGGGDMIQSVTFKKTTYREIPYRFEAGTPNIAGTIGLGAAIDYLDRIGMANVAAYEKELLAYGTDRLAEVKGLKFIGTAKDKRGVLAFTLRGVHPHDIATILDQEGIAVRAGHHCAQPVMAHFGVPATTRASLGLYNTRADIDALVIALRNVKEVFHV